MARVFLDTNAFIDLSRLRNNLDIEELKAYDLLISPLSVHILFYSYKQCVPNNDITGLVEQLILVYFDQTIVNRALAGPTADFEDNVQLHSASQAKADYFLTSDEKLLKMKFFGETEIIPQLTDTTAD